MKKKKNNQIKERMAHVNLSTGKIYGASKGSFKWWHEKGHLLFNSTPKFSFLLLIQEYLFSFWMITIMLAIIWKPFIFPSIIIFVSYFAISFYEEMWCNGYALQRIKK